MGVYIGDGFTRRKLSALPVDDKPEVKNEKPASVTGLGALTTGFLSSTSAHGLPKVVSETSYIRKFAWLLIFMVASAMFCLMMYYDLVKYCSHPVEINIKYKGRMEAEFPAVTVCNLNPLKKSKLDGSPYQALKDIDGDPNDSLTSSSASKTFEETDPSVSSTHSPLNNQRNIDLQAAMSAQGTSGDFTLQNMDFMMNAADDRDFKSFMEYSQTDDYSDITDLFKPTKGCIDAFGHQAKDFILQCSFDKTNCSYLDFKKVYNNRYGSCFVFNLNSTTTTLHGSKYGLRLTLNVEPDDYVGLFSQEVGVRVAVHAANVTAFPEDEGVNAPTGYSTSIGVTTSTFTRLPPPYASMCADGTNHTLLDNNEYTVWACGLACLQSNLKNACECLDMAGLPRSGKRCSLTNATQEICRQRIYALYKKGKLGCYCPQPCNQVQYNTKVSMSTWPSIPYIPILWHNIGGDLQDVKYTNVEDAKRTLARVHVYMEDLTVHSTEEYAAFTVEDLFANMGGYLGLFIGISACTVMEFFEFLIDAMGYAVITMCGGSLVRQTKKKTGLTISSTPMDTVKQPPQEHLNNSKTNKKPRILQVQPITDADVVDFGFNPKTMCW